MKSLIYHWWCWWLETLKVLGLVLVCLFVAMQGFGWNVQITIPDVYHVKVQK